MTAQLLTLVSGVVLLLVFAIVGWYQRRQRNSGPDNRRENRD